MASTSGCGTSLHATYCLENITFTPPASGTTTGTLSIVSNEPGSPNVVQLIGTTATISATPASVSLGSVVHCSTSTATVTVTNNSWGARSIVARLIAEGIVELFEVIEV